MEILKSVHHLHFIGIGGIGMSAIARYCAALGKKVTGSDCVANSVTQDLQREGIKVKIGHAAKNLSSSTGMIIVSNAIAANNPELLLAKQRHLPVLLYAEFLGELTQCKFTVAVCGTHGKSTTTAMIALMMVAGGLDPTVIVGTKLSEFGGSNFRMGQSNFLVIEADEYRRAFLQYHPRIVVLTNVDLDHLDYYRDEADYVKAFAQFAKTIPHGGFLVSPENCRHLPAVNRSNKGELVTVRFQPDKFELGGHPYDYIRSQVPGMHNRHNSSLAFAVGKILDIPEGKIASSLQAFAGTWRRFEHKGKLSTGAICIDDYGHHPAEIRATLQGARELFPEKRIICVFQPHQYSRTHHLFSQFVTAFEDADMVIVPDIYAARDTVRDKEKITVDMFVQAVNHHTSAVNGQGLPATAHWLLQNSTKNDVILTMGAGDITTIYEYW